MLHQLPVAHPEPLVEFLYQDPGQPRDDGPQRWDEYENIRDQSRVFSAVTGVTFDNLAKRQADGGEPETLILENVLGNYFQVLGLKPAIGRLTLAEFGGVRGMAGEALIESALARPRNKYACEPESAITLLAASCAFGLARNHAFVDGNQRAAFLSIGVFLSINGCRLVADQVDAIQKMCALAAGKLDGKELAAWVKRNSVRVAARRS